MTLQLAGLASDEPTTSHLHPGDDMILSLLNKAKQLAVIFVPFSLSEMRAYDNETPHGDFISGKIVGYSGAIDLTGTANPLFGFSGNPGDENMVYTRPDTAGYAWWHVHSSEGVKTFRWSGKDNTDLAIACHIREPDDIDQLTDIGIGVEGWIHTFCATFAAMSIALWNRNLRLAMLLAGYLSKMVEPTLAQSQDVILSAMRMAQVIGQPPPLA